MNSSLWRTKHPIPQCFTTSTVTNSFQRSIVHTLLLITNSKIPSKDARSLLWVHFSIDFVCFMFRMYFIGAQFCSECWYPLLCNIQVCSVIIYLAMESTVDYRFFTALQWCFIIMSAFLSQSKQSSADENPCTFDICFQKSKNQTFKYSTTKHLHHWLPNNHLPPT